MTRIPSLPLAMLAGEQLHSEFVASLARRFAEAPIRPRPVKIKIRFGGLTVGRTYA